MSLSRLILQKSSLIRPHISILCTAKRFNTVDCSQADLIYEGPFSVLSTRLKAVSISSAAVGAIGIPVLIALYSGDVPEIGQYALGGTTMLAACGSTAAVNFCFAPYVHTLERVPMRKCQGKEETPEEVEARAAQDYLIKATWRNMFVMKQETVFDPATDVTEYKGIRPFCNFIAKGVPLFVHPEVVMDDNLRKQLLGEKEAARYNMPDKANRKYDEDELF